MLILNLIFVLMVSLGNTRFENEADSDANCANELNEYSCINYLKYSVRVRKTTVDPAFQGLFTEVFPSCIEKPDPVYPDSALEAGLEGTVVVWIILDSKGTVRNVKLYYSSGYDILNQAACDAAWETKWTPAERRRGEYIDSRTTMTYVFTLPE